MTIATASAALMPAQGTFASRSDLWRSENGQETTSSPSTRVIRPSTPPGRGCSPSHQTDQRASSRGAVPRAIG